MTQKLTPTTNAQKRGYARWEGISKKDRSAEMSRVAKLLWVKIKAGKLDK